MYMTETNLAQIQEIERTKENLKGLFNPVKQTKSFLKIFLITAGVMIGLCLLYLLLSVILLISQR